MTDLQAGPAEPAGAGPGLRLRVPGIRLRRAVFLLLVGGNALAGIALMANILGGGGGFSALEVLILALFAATFSWICVSFWNAILGFFLVLLRRDPLSLGPEPLPLTAGGPLMGTTAIVMPAHNEDPRRVIGGLGATIESLVATGHAPSFEVHLLSDTSDPGLAERELAAWQHLRGRWEGRIRLHYRRRERNQGRKAGNIAEFCRRAGHGYDYMVVLDADSVMTGPTLVTLARTMDANPRAGILQTIPLPAGQTTVFGRLLQFAAWLYSPILAAGQSFWQGDTGNYWGHNAILRLAPFIEHCELPVLPGDPPLGGEVISHDFVEGALMRRAGFGVYVLSWLGGSYEEVPETIPDYAKRDRRWAQGSLQHMRLLFTPGLRAISRLHFLFGAVGYVSSLLWLAMLLAGTAYVALDSAGIEMGVLGPASSFQLPAAARIVSLLAITAVILFGPKLLAVVLALARRREEFGGSARLLVSALLETIFAIVVAPVMMMFHSRFVISVLARRAVPWDPQRRGGADLDWRTTMRSAGWISAAGLGWTMLTCSFSPRFALWLSPIFAGLLLAMPLVRWTGGLVARRPVRPSRLFATPPAPVADAARGFDDAP